MIAARLVFASATLWAAIYCSLVFNPTLAITPIEGKLQEHMDSSGHPKHTTTLGAPEANHSRPAVKSMLKNQTMMRNHLENENLMGMKVIQGFCMDGLHCWPLQVFSFTMLAVHILCCFSAFYVSAQLYSSGLRSASFYQNGGVVLIVMALLGAATGIVLSQIFEFCIIKTAAFTGPMMSVFMSMALIGKRGMILGGFGGLCAGIPIGSMIESYGVGLSLGAIIGLLVGGILGICPFFHWLEMNQRYMNKQHEFGSFAEPGSFSSDGYQGYQKVIQMNTSDYH